MITKEMENINEIRNKEFYKTLDFFVNSLKTTRSSIAKKCGMGCSTLNPSKCINNRWISLGSFFRICDALNVKPQEFINKMKI